MASAAFVAVSAAPVEAPAAASAAVAAVSLSQANGKWRSLVNHDPLPLLHEFSSHSRLDPKFYLLFILHDIITISYQVHLIARMMYTGG